MCACVRLCLSVPIIVCMRVCVCVWCVWLGAPPVRPPQIKGRGRAPASIYVRMCMSVCACVVPVCLAVWLAGCLCEPVLIRPLCVRRVGELLYRLRRPAAPLLPQVAPLAHVVRDGANDAEPGERGATPAAPYVYRVAVSPAALVAGCQDGLLMVWEFASHADPCLRS
jgi:hypothetical protein